MTRRWLAYSSFPPEETPLCLVEAPPPIHPRPFSLPDGFRQGQGHPVSHPLEARQGLVAESGSLACEA